MHITFALEMSRLNQSYVLQNRSFFLNSEYGYFMHEALGVSMMVLSIYRNEICDIYHPPRPSCTIFFFKKNCGLEKSNFGLV